LRNEDGMSLKFWLAALVACFALGATVGYRYASGRCAKQSLGAVHAALETARQQQSEADTANSQAAKKEAAKITRQTEERVRYVQVIKEVPVAADCRVPEPAYRLLVDAVRAANASAAGTH
jgi:hypothetical protein